MNTKEALKSAMDLGLHVLNTYISDLDDNELILRPTAGCNHLAWQLGHLISSEVGMLDSIYPGQAAKLPSGFAEKHSKDTARRDDPKAFCTKQEYIDLFAKVRQATLSALESLPESDLDKPSPEQMRPYFPTVGAVFTLIGAHPLMHAGQFVIVRRQLGKPVLI